MAIKIGLPKGRLMGATAALLGQAGWGLDGYHEGARIYRIQSTSQHSLFAKIFHERDVPVQVAIGNYDLGICGSDWVDELLVKYPSSSLVKIRDLNYGGGTLHLVTGQVNGVVPSLADFQSWPGNVRLVSEYPNLAEVMALNLRLREFSILPLWGGAEAYPPESAELALLPGSRGEQSFGYGLASLGEIRQYRAYIIANKESWGKKDMSGLLASLEAAIGVLDLDTQVAPFRRAGGDRPYFPNNGDGEDIVRLALPDGHQQKPTVALLKRAGIMLDDYPSKTANRRPQMRREGVVVKVIRPQDMPLQVANNNFDLAITGQDWVRDHRYQFPGSPVRELAELGFGGVRIVSVMKEDVAVNDVTELRRFTAEQPRPLRIASEYVNIADKYARDNHLGRYRVVPTWGATEAFLPEDADLLIENTQTGSTLAKNKLKIIDTLGHSVACLVGRDLGSVTARKRARIEALVEVLQRAAAADGV